MLVTEKNYYITVTYSDGKASGPTRLRGVHDPKTARKKLKKHQKHYPDCKVEIKEVEELKL